ncbi:MAG TPA: alpha-N-arabinofuranosidase [Longimicrobiales bacterium]
MFARPVAAAALLVLCCLRPAAAQSPDTLRMVLNADLGETTISRHIYGHFAEHLGHGIYGGFWVRDGDGEYHLRDDIIEALRRIKIPNLRWPGGCFADYYHWRDGIGPRDQRPVMVNTVWGGVTEDNSFGTHEFMELVERLGAEPIVVGNVGSGTVREMAEWWEYVNHPGGSTLAELRRKNGHAEPWNVRFWGVGNESWGCGGSMTPEHYADVYKRFATFLRSYGNVRPFRIASGPNVGDYRWTETVMREAGWMIDGLDLHYYTVVGPWNHKGSATDFTEREWFVAMQKALRMEELITRHSSIMDRYDPQKRVALIVGEWGMWHDVEPGTNPGFLYQQNALRDAVVAALTLNIFNRHADRVRMASIAQTINVLQSMILTRGDEMILTPTYHVFDLYKVHQDATLLPLEFDAGAYVFEGDTVPAVSASASRDKEGRIHITLANLDPHRPRTLRTDVRGEDVARVSGRVLTAATMGAHNTFEEPDAVAPAEFHGARLAGDELIIQLPAKSVVLLELLPRSMVAAQDR